MNEERMFIILLKEKDSNLLQFAASYKAVTTLDAAGFLVAMVREHETHTEKEIKKAKIVHDDKGGVIHIGNREYYLVTDEFVAQAPPNVQQIYIDIIKRSAKNELPC